MIQKLKDREIELKKQLVELSSKINKNKFTLRIRYNVLRCYKRDLYTTLCEVENPELYCLSDWQVRSKYVEACSLRADIDCYREMLKELEPEQRQLIFQYKDVSRQLTKLQQRIKRKQLISDMSDTMYNNRNNY